MDNELVFSVNDVSEDNFHSFLQNTNANLQVSKLVSSIVEDYSWIDKIEEAIPYIDNIIRNPKRFIVSEEDIIPIEKTKHVTEESIKHLATHTNLIQDVDFNGDVKPIKLLNVFREETIDLYENRFIYTLIKNLDIFLSRQIIASEDKALNSEEKSVKYTADTKFGNRDINVELSLNSKQVKERKENPDKVMKRNQRIAEIQEVLQGFMASKFMQTMNNATMVKSPIRKTNIILKEQNFVKALELWNFLEIYQIEHPTTHLTETFDLTNDSYANDFGMTYYLNYGILNEIVSKSGNYLLENTENIYNSVYEYIKRYDINENEFKSIIEKKIIEVSDYKKEQKKNVRDCYANLLNNHYNRIKKATALIE